MTISRNRNNDVSFQLYNNEDEYKNATSNWQIMKSHKINKILGLVAIGINVLFVFKSLYLLYVYNFTGILFLFMYPNWVLVINALLGIIGIYISILLFKNMIGIKLFLILTFVLWGIMIGKVLSDNFLIFQIQNQQYMVQMYECFILLVW